MVLMANSNKRTLSKNLAQMKFMKRRSRDLAASTLDSSVGALIEKWVAPDIPPVANKSLSHDGVHAYVDSFVECEDLNQFGRFSFNKFNKDVEADRLCNGVAILEINEDMEYLPQCEECKRMNKSRIERHATKKKN